MCDCCMETRPSEPGREPGSSRGNSWEAGPWGGTWWGSPSNSLLVPRETSASLPAGRRCFSDLALCVGSFLSIPGSAIISGAVQVSFLSLGHGGETCLGSQPALTQRHRVCWSGRDGVSPKVAGVSKELECREGEVPWQVTPCDPTLLIRPTSLGHSQLWIASPFVSSPVRYSLSKTRASGGPSGATPYQWLHSVFWAICTPLTLPPPPSWLAVHILE